MTENKEIKKVEVGDSPFVTDEDVFDIAIEYYKEDKKIMAEGSDKFDDKKAKSRIVFTMRYPSQADCESIMQQSRTMVDFSKDMDVQSLLRMESVRFLTLIKSWSVDKELNNENIMALHPDIIRHALVKIREEIGVHGLF